MAAIVAKTNRLVEVARDTDPPQPNTLQRLREVLMGVVGFSMKNTSFVPLLMGSLDEHINSLTCLKRKVDVLTALLESARRLSSTTHRHDSSVACLTGLHGDDLFRKLMALHFLDTMPPEIYLEAALAAQRLIMHDMLDNYIRLYEKIIFENNTMAAHENKIRIFRDHMLTLEKFVQEHMELATAAMPRPSTSPAT
uniref:Uncharacterized protein n=1 Tax=Avena sativa TaxID=4498 RepID=A0ACD5XUR4_AVESA